MQRLLVTLLIVLTNCSCANYEKNPAFYAYTSGPLHSETIKKEKNGEVYITPASLQKVVTAVVAYKDLGSDFQFKTNLYRLNKTDYLIEFSGDPTLTSEDIKELFKDIHHPQNIYLDLRAFKTPEISKNIMLDDIGYSYAQPVFAGNLDQNLITVTVHKNGAVHLDPHYIAKSDIKIDAPTKLSFKWDNEHLLIYGTLCDTKTFSMAPAKMHPYLLKKSKALFQHSHIYIMSHAQKHKTLIKTHNSKPLKELLRPALAASNNLFFDTLYLVLLHKHEKEFHDWNKGDLVMKRLITQYLDVNFENSLFVDGSGLSRYNRISPKVLLKIMRKSYPILKEIMPQPEDEKSTLKDKGFPSDLFFKTGSMSGVSNLCGFYKGQAFVFVMNGFDTPSTPNQIAFVKSLS